MNTFRKNCRKDSCVILLTNESSGNVLFISFDSSCLQTRLRHTQEPATNPTNASVRKAGMGDTAIKVSGNCLGSQTLAYLFPGPKGQDRQAITQLCFPLHKTNFSSSCSLQWSPLPPELSKALECRKESITIKYQHICKISPQIFSGLEDVLQVALVIWYVNYDRNE